MADNTTIRYNDEELQEFKELIEKKLVKSREELAYLQERISDSHQSSNETQSGDWLDDSSSHSGIEMLNNMANRLQHFISSLESAIVRIDNKTYGICVVTGKLIDKKRLYVVPHATKSIEAKEFERKAKEKRRRK